MVRLCSTKSPVILLSKCGRCHTSHTQKGRNIHLSSTRENNNECFSQWWMIISYKMAIMTKTWKCMLTSAEQKKVNGYDSIFEEGEIDLYWLLHRKGRGTLILAPWLSPPVLDCSQYERLRFRRRTCSNSPLWQLVEVSTSIDQKQIWMQC